MSWIRAAAAAILSFLMPGAGHALIRDWFRALAIAGLYLSLLYLFIPSEALTGGFSMDAVTSPAEEMDFVGQLSLMVVMLFAITDSMFRALGVTGNKAEPTAAGEATSCPHCGRDLDADLTFCHWCTTQLEPETADENEERTEAEAVESR